jgi:hypothetical protein
MRAASGPGVLAGHEGPQCTRRGRRTCPFRARAPPALPRSAPPADSAFTSGAGLPTVLFGPEGRVSPRLFAHLLEHLPLARDPLLEHAEKRALGRDEALERVDRPL